jgi:hypothetical protein
VVLYFLFCFVLFSLVSFTPHSPLPLTPLVCHPSHSPPFHPPFTPHSLHPFTPPPHPQDFLAALYHDDGSGGWTDHSNVVHGLGKGKGKGQGVCADCMPWVSMWSPYSHDITVTANYVDCDCVDNAGTRTKVAGTVVVPTGGVWPAPAQEVIAKAGPRARP